MLRVSIMVFRSISATNVYNCVLRVVLCSGIHISNIFVSQVKHISVVVVDSGYSNSLVVFCDYIRKYLLAFVCFLY